MPGLEDVLLGSQLRREHEAQLGSQDAARLIAQGDTQGALQRAGQSGSLDLVERVRGLSQGELQNVRKQALQNAALLSQEAAAVLGVPREQRQQYLRNRMPVYQRLLPGVDPRQILNVSDEQLYALANASPERNIDDLLAQRLGKTETRDNQIVNLSAGNTGRGEAALVGELGPSIRDQLQARNLDIQQQRLNEERLQFAASQRGEGAGPQSDAAQGAITVIRSTGLKAGLQLDNIENAIGEIGNFNTGFLFGTEDAVLGNPQARINLQQALEPIKANVFLGELNELKRISAAAGGRGSGLGQVTEREILLLQRSINSLESAQSKDQLIAALVRVANQTERALNETYNEYVRAFGSAEGYPIDRSAVQAKIAQIKGAAARKLGGADRLQRLDTNPYDANILSGDSPAAATGGAQTGAPASAPASAGNVPLYDLEGNLINGG